jgi:hypothetical protein
MQDKNVFEFVIYVIHACADKWNKLPSEVYKLLDSKDCINNFLVSNYDILHTQSTANIIEDIKEYLKVRGVSV